MDPLISMGNSGHDICELLTMLALPYGRASDTSKLRRQHKFPQT